MSNFVFDWQIKKDAVRTMKVRLSFFSPYIAKNDLI